MYFENILIKIYKRFWENHLFHKNIILLIDSVLVLFSSLVAFLFTQHIYKNLLYILERPAMWLYLLFILGIYLFFFEIFKTYKGIIRYSTVREFGRVLLALTCSMVTVFGVLYWLFEPSGTIALVYSSMVYLCSLVCLYGFRIISVYIFQRLVYHYGDTPKIPVLIWELNEENLALAQLLNAGHNKFSIIGFMTVETSKRLKQITNFPVYEVASTDDLANYYDVKNVLFTSENDLSKYALFVEKLLQFGKNIYIAQELNINNVSQLSSIGHNIRSVQIEDLLGRNEIQINMLAIAENIRNRIILVTGAAGSIGSEIVNQVARFAPKLLICLDIAESPLNDLEIELTKKFPTLNFKGIIGDIRDRKKMEYIFRTFTPQVIWHCAAYKHVPLMERFPREAAYTNILGTKQLVDLSIKYRVEMFVMISTDKAVNPSNIMGATKRIAEIYVQSAAADPNKNASKTKFVTTRFGNVLGSNGSVIPLFKRQIERGGPITVTHPEITRYFMTIPEACRLVLEASVIGKSGYIYIFDMGKPVKIANLARRMIELSGLVPDKDIKIEYTGLRLGEKLYEELLSDSEITESTVHHKIKMAKVREYQFIDILPKIETIIELVKSNESTELVRQMKELVPEFISNNSEFEKLDVKH